MLPSFAHAKQSKSEGKIQRSNEKNMPLEMLNQMIF
jgi:hypothetical protein